MSETLGKAPVAHHQPPIFPIACWTLGLVAFSQLVIGGLALAARLESSQRVRIVEKEVPKFIQVEVPVKRADGEEASVVARPPASALPPVAAIPDPLPIVAPAIEDPESEKLVRDARKARVAGDMMSAITKLEESLKQSPQDPTVHYELGLVYEAMDVYDKASEHYEKVFQMGVTGAGKLYELAGAKLRDGFEQPTDWLGKLALGRVRIFNDTQYENGQRVVLTIPVQKDPAADIDLGEMEVSVLFFNRTSKGEIVQLEDKSWVTKQEWAAMPFDWAGGEEPLRVTYVIPSQDTRTEHLFGMQSYYGQVVTLSYKREVIDVQAWPRDLSARVSKPAASPGQQQVPEFLDQLPPDFNPDNPLLPTPQAPLIESLPLPHR
jgi:hypothetical protein